MKMRNFFLICISLLLGACTQYQFITLDSPVYQKDKQVFVWENDTVKLQYNFSGADCPITIQVYNKLSQPIYVDWKKSSVIYSDGSRWALWNDESYVNTSTTGGAVKVRNYSFSGAATEGVIQKKEQVSFIPPNSYVSLRPMSVRSTFISPLPSELKQRVKFGLLDDTKVDKYSFTSESTPFSFRCFLTLSTNEAFSQPIYVDQPVWVSELVVSSMSPSDVLQSSNLFYVSKTTAFGHVMGGVGTAAILAGAVYLETTTPPPPPHRR